MHALTSYINADPDARAWLDGAPDPWGMVVNPNYKGIELPTYSWPLLDTFEPPKLYASDTNDCLYNNPVPFLPLVAAPLPRFAAITQAMQFSIANSTVVCQQIADNTRRGREARRDRPADPRLPVHARRHRAGRRPRYQLDTASLLTHVDPPAPAAFTSAAGRTFVAPTNACAAGRRQAAQAGRHDRHLADPVRRARDAGERPTRGRWSCTRRWRPRACPRPTRATTPGC